MGFFIKKQAAATPEINWCRLGTFIALALASFTVSVLLAHNPLYQAHSVSLLRAFELLLAGMLALLGIDTAKNG
jgi:hypothetical protein